MKIWIKLIIFGIILFFVGVVYITATGGSIANSSEGMLISFGGAILVAVGILSGLARGFNRMMRE
jgi:hypothetical protein